MQSKDRQAIRALAAALARLTDAELRRGTERDGNWGFPSFYEEIRVVNAEAVRIGLELDEA